MSNSSLPTLTPTVFHILLALAESPCHGYEIIKRIEADTDGRIVLLTGTLYGAIKRLLEDGWMEEAPERPQPMDDDSRRRYYQLSPAGMEALQEEIGRYEAIVALIHRRFGGAHA